MRLRTTPGADRLYGLTLRLRRWLAPSLYKRMFTVHLAVLSVFIAGNGALGWYAYAERGTGAVDQDLKLIAEAMARMAAMKLDHEGARRAGAEIEEMNRQRSYPRIQPEEFAFRIWSNDGRLLARSLEEPALPDMTPSAISRRERTDLNGWAFIESASPDGRAIAAVGYSKSMYNRVILQALRDLIPNFIFGVVQISLALMLAIKVGLRPLLSLSREIETNPPTDASALRDPQLLELRPIVQALNRLLEKVRIQQEQERTFFADAAHELRTPLAVINAQAHALAASQTPDSQRIALRALESGVSRSAAVLDKLLTLARLDASPNKISLTNLTEIARSVVTHQLDRTLSSNHDLGFHSDGDVFAYVDPLAIAVAIDNLIDNALRYTPNGATVDVRVTHEGDDAVLVVEDSGLGIPPAEWQSVFRRFERGSTANGIGGSGLGLAIVQEAASRCSGTAELDSSITLGGARFRLRFKAAEAPRSP